VAPVGHDPNDSIFFASGSKKFIINLAITIPIDETTNGTFDDRNETIAWALSYWSIRVINRFN
jgi:hypothetical protein